MTDISKKPILDSSIFSQLYFATQPEDLEVHIKDEVIKVHKLVLTMHSPILKHMLECNNDNNSILTLDCDPKIFKLLIDILSHRFTFGQFKVNLKNFVELTNLIDYFDISHLCDFLNRNYHALEYEPEVIYTLYCCIKYKPAKKICLQKILHLLSIKTSRLVLLKAIKNTDNLFYFLTEYKKAHADKNLETFIYHTIYEWQVVNDSSSIEKYNSLLLAVDFSNFKLKDLVKHTTTLKTDLGAKFDEILAEKLKAHNMHKEDIYYLANY